MAKFTAKEKIIAVQCYLNGTEGYNKEDKVKVIYELRHKYSVKALLALANIPRSTYHVAPIM